MRRYGIGVGLIWRETDYAEVTIWGQSKQFGGSTLACDSYDVLERFAEAIKGFPKSLADTRTFEVGHIDPGHELGGVKLSFFCTDSQGHAAVRIQIVKREATLETADFVLPIAASSVDNSVDELLKLHHTLIGSAFLQMYEE
jgi:hypothetical protein